MNTEFPQLHDFLGAYFHQDWPVEHATAEEVISAFLADSDADTLIAVYQEIDALLQLQKNETSLREYLLKELSCYYCYWVTWNSGNEWLKHLADKLNYRM